MTCLLVILAGLNACVTESDSPTLYVGMSRDRLKAHFGEPLRVEVTPLGEDWYYRFASWRNAGMEGSVYHDGVSSSGSFSVTISDENNIRDFPVHLSSEGYVRAPLPVGKIVRQ